jgi:hemoglobin
VRIHSGNGPHEEMDRRAMACFDQALDDVELSTAEPVRQVLHDYFAWATTTTLSRYHESADVPDGLSIPKWSWNGLQNGHTAPINLEDTLADERGVERGGPNPSSRSR